jgi:hypothetical protein
LLLDVGVGSGTLLDAAMIAPDTRGFKDPSLQDPSLPNSFVEQQLAISLGKIVDVA